MAVLGVLSLCRQEQGGKVAERAAFEDKAWSHYMVQGARTDEVVRRT